MPCVVGKVAAFVVRQTPTGIELLLFEHPYAGNQFPAGTVEEGETAEQAACREAEEETGLVGLVLRGRVGTEDRRLPDGRGIMARTAPVYSRPDPNSICWATIRNGLWVRVLRSQPGYLHVTYEEWDQWPDWSYATYQITGWVAEDAVCETQRRDFYLFECTTPTPDRWVVGIDNHVYTLFWAPVANLPQIVTPQDQWLAYLPKDL
jgi:8-oxo-dGTP pyrophosphatase MutT (NUDIX family)